MDTKVTLEKALLYLAWLTAVSAMVGSLFLSEIWKLPPCLLCWYQRLAMYPLVPIITVGIFTRDKKLPLYVLPLSLVGLIIAAYHNLLYYGLIPESIAPCQLGISCTTKFFEWFGFITIPFLSLSAFAVVTAIMSYLLWRQSKKK